MPKFIDLSGQKIEHFIILERDFATQKEKHSKEIFWKCKCDCGTTFSSRGHDIRQGKVKSCGCLRKVNTRNINFKDLTGQQFGFLTILYELPERIDHHCVWRCKCQCGNETNIMGKHLLSGQTKSCGCLKSTGEALVVQVLQQLGIEFETQKSFVDCNNVLPLKFDFYLPKMNIVIECQGQQHYEPIKIFGGEERFEQQIKCDKIKEEWCKTNNIKLIKIPYYKYKQINCEYINNLIKQ